MTTTTPSTTPQESLLLEVAIIGCGPAGIVAAKTLLDHHVPPSGLAVFDETSSAGGIWNQENRPQVPCHIVGDTTCSITLEVPSSSQPVYRDLKTNFPKDMTSFLGYPFPAEVEMFPVPTLVAQYYQDFWAKTGVDKVTHLNTRVETCTKQGEVWKISTQNTHTNKQQHYKSKRLLVCNGHFRKPFCPALPGIQHFRGKVLHSSAFDSPLDYNNQTVLIIGGSVSGSDIAKILLTRGNCRRVIVSARTWKTYQGLLLPSLQKKQGLIVRPGIQEIDSQGSIRFQPAPLDKKGKYTSTNKLPSTEKPDVILFATGYRYYFPFLKVLRTPFVRSDGYKMERLYKRIVSVDDPSLAFLGVTNQNISPALSLDYQAQWYAKIVFPGEVPSMQVMMEEVQSRADDPTQDGLAAKFPGYCNSLAKDIGARGYWAQILMNRIPLMLRTWWVRRQSKSWLPVALPVAGGAVLVLASALLKPSGFLRHLP